VASPAFALNSFHFTCCIRLQTTVVSQQPSIYCDKPIALGETMALKLVQLPLITTNRTINIIPVDHDLGGLIPNAPILLAQRKDGTGWQALHTQATYYQG
jgi:hypothetical protein